MQQSTESLKEKRMRTNKPIFIFAAKCLPASSLVILPLELEKPVSRKCACSLTVNSILFRSIWQFSSPLNNTTLHLYSSYRYIYIYISAVDSWTGFCWKLWKEVNVVFKNTDVQWSSRSLISDAQLISLERTYLSREIEGVLKCPFIYNTDRGDRICFPSHWSAG